MARLRADVEYLEKAVSRPAPEQSKTIVPTIKAASLSKFTPLPDSSVREFLNPTITPEFICKMRRDLTGMQGDKIASTYVGKWLRVSGKVSKTGYQNGETFIHVTVVDNGDIRDKLSSQVTLYFDGEIPAAVAMAVGDPISGLGQIQDISDLGIILIHSELEAQA